MVPSKSDHSDSSVMTHQRIGVNYYDDKIIRRNTNANLEAQYY